MENEPSQSERRRKAPAWKAEADGRQVASGGFEGGQTSGVSPGIATGGVGIGPNLRSFGINSSFELRA